MEKSLEKLLNEPYLMYRLERDPGSFSSPQTNPNNRVVKAHANNQEIQKNNTGNNTATKSSQPPVQQSALPGSNPQTKEPSSKSSHDKNGASRNNLESTSWLVSTKAKSAPSGLGNTQSGPSDADSQDGSSQLTQAQKIKIGFQVLIKNLEVVMKPTQMLKKLLLISFLIILI